MTDGWRASGSPWLGRTVTRTVYNEAAGQASKIQACVVSWLDADESDFVDASGTAAALWKIQYVDGELGGEEEDLEQHQLFESVPPEVAAELRAEIEGSSKKGGGEAKTRKAHGLPLKAAKRRADEAHAEAPPKKTRAPAPPPAAPPPMISQPPRRAAAAAAMARGFCDAQVSRRDDDDDEVRFRLARRAARELRSETGASWLRVKDIARRCREYAAAPTSLAEEAYCDEGFDELNTIMMAMEIPSNLVLGTSQVIEALQQLVVRGELRFRAADEAYAIVDKTKDLEGSDDAYDEADLEDAPSSRRKKKAQAIMAKSLPEAYGEVFDETTGPGAAEWWPQAREVRRAVLTAEKVEEEEEGGGGGPNEGTAGAPAAATRPPSSTTAEARQLAEEAAAEAAAAAVAEMDLSLAVLTPFALFKKENYDACVAAAMGGHPLNHDPAPGWYRELVKRQTAEKVDVYYHSPYGRQVRSRPDVARYFEAEPQAAQVAGEEGRVLTPGDFTFSVAAKQTTEELRRCKKLNVDLIKAELQRRWEALTEADRDRYAARALETERAVRRQRADAARRIRDAAADAARTMGASPRVARVLSAQAARAQLPDVGWDDLVRDLTFFPDDNGKNNDGREAQSSDAAAMTTTTTTSSITEKKGAAEDAAKGEKGSTTAEDAAHRALLIQELEREEEARMARGAVVTLSSRTNRPRRAASQNARYAADPARARPADVVFLALDRVAEASGASVDWPRLTELIAESEKKARPSDECAAFTAAPYKATRDGLATLVKSGKARRSVADLGADAAAVAALVSDVGAPAAVVHDAALREAWTRHVKTVACLRAWALAKLQPAVLASTRPSSSTNKGTWVGRRLEHDGVGGTVFATNVVEEAAAAHKKEVTDVVCAMDDGATVTLSVEAALSAVAKCEPGIRWPALEADAHCRTGTGQMIMIWWDGDNVFYPGSVVARSTLPESPLVGDGLGAAYDGGDPHPTNEGGGGNLLLRASKYLVLYEDGSSDWYDLRVEKIRLEKATAAFLRMEAVLRDLNLDDHHGLFQQPVDPIAENLPDYSSVIARPMDLGTVGRRLQTDAYDGEEPDDAARARLIEAGCLADLRLTFENAMTYNRGRHDDVYRIAASAKSKLERLVKQQALAAPSSSGAADSQQLSGAALARQASTRSARPAAENQTSDYEDESEDESDDDFEGGARRRGARPRGTKQASHLIENALRFDHLLALVNRDADTFAHPPDFRLSREAMGKRRFVDKYIHMADLGGLELGAEPMQVDGGSNGAADDDAAAPKKNEAPADDSKAARGDDEKNHHPAMRRMTVEGGGTPHYGHFAGVVAASPIDEACGDASAPSAPAASGGGDLLEGGGKDAAPPPSPPPPQVVPKIIEHVGRHAVEVEYFEAAHKRLRSAEASVGPYVGAVAEGEWQVRAPLARSALAYILATLVKSGHVVHVADGSGGAVFVAANTYRRGTPFDRRKRLAEAAPQQMEENLSEYELQRKAKIAQNHAFLVSLGLAQA